MAASFKDPSASAVTRAEASVVFPSISAASRGVVGVLKLGHEHRTVSVAHYHPGVGNIVRPEELVQASDERNRGEDVSLKHSSFNVERLRHHIHPTRQSDAHDTGCCGEDGLDDASHLRADASVRKCAIEKYLTF